VQRTEENNEESGASEGDIQSDTQMKESPEVVPEEPMVSDSQQEPRKADEQ